MGLVYTDVIVSNIKDDKSSFSGSFLVDTGAADSVVRADELEKIGVERKFKRNYELADGSIVPYDVGAAWIRFNDEETAASVVFGDNGTEPLLGVTVLQSLGFVVDPGTHSLMKKAAITLK